MGRTDEKAKNKHTIMDSKAAQRAVGQATAVLKDFYKKAAKATALIQTSNKDPAIIHMGTEEWQALANPNFDGTIDKGHKAGMQTFGESYTGNQDAAGGVMALLEVALSDFANLEADTKATEAEADNSYNKFMTEAKRSKATKSKKIELDDYFVNLTDMSTTWVKAGALYEGKDRATGARKWRASLCDMTLGSNAELRAVCEHYAMKDSKKQFVQDFANAWSKVMHADSYGRF